MKKTLEVEGVQVFVPPFTPTSGRLGIPYLAEQLKDYIHTHLPSDQRFHLLGYSMGRLISRYYLQRLGGLDRVEEFITISTPHHGTHPRPLPPILADFGSQGGELTHQRRIQRCDGGCNRSSIRYGQQQSEIIMVFGDGQA